jgi:hypothetical protein
MTQPSLKKTGSSSDAIVTLSCRRTGARGPKGAEDNSNDRGPRCYIQLVHYVYLFSSMVPLSKVKYIDQYNDYFLTLI